jgi:hypothetical protein
MGAVTVPELEQLKKMKIEQYKSQTFQETDLLEEWTVLFNPSEFTLTRANEFNQQATQGRSRPKTSFGKGLPDQLSLTLFFDGTGVVGEAGPITESIHRFLSLSRYRGTEHHPAYIRVWWGRLDFRGVLKSAAVTFTLFNRAGEPLRARVAASFEEVISGEELRAEESSSSPNLLQVWHVTEGDRLDQIAFETYGDARYWRAVAEVNRLENPRRLVPGETLLLPPVEHSRG